MGVAYSMVQHASLITAPSIKPHAKCQSFSFRYKTYIYTTCLNQINTVGATSEAGTAYPTHGQCVSPCTPASSTTKTDRHDIAEILLKVALKHQKSIKSIIDTIREYVKQIIGLKHDNFTNLNTLTHELRKATEQITKPIARSLMW